MIRAAGEIWLKEDGLIDRQGGWIAADIRFDLDNRPQRWSSLVVVTDIPCG